MLLATSAVSYTCARFRVLALWGGVRGSLGRLILLEWAGVGCSQCRLGFASRMYLNCVTLCACFVQVLHGIDMAWPGIDSAPSSFRLARPRSHALLVQKDTENALVPKDTEKAQSTHAQRGYDLSYLALSLLNHTRCRCGACALSLPHQQTCIACHESHNTSSTYATRPVTSGVLLHL